MNETHNNQNAFTGLLFSNLNNFGNVKVIKAPAGFELTTNRFGNNALTQCCMLLDKIFGKENIYDRRYTSPKKAFYWLHVLTPRSQLNNTGKNAITWHDYTLWIAWYASSSQATVHSPHSFLQMGRWSYIFAMVCEDKYALNILNT